MWYRNTTIHLLCGNSIVLSAYKEESRLQRLAAVIGFVAAKDPDVLAKIVEINDQKGELTVLWKSEDFLNVEDRGHFGAAWDSVIGDGGGNIKHKMFDKVVI